MLKWLNFPEWLPENASTFGEGVDNLFGNIPNLLDYRHRVYSCNGGAYCLHDQVPL